MTKISAFLAVFLGFICLPLAHAASLANVNNAMFDLNGARPEAMQKHVLGRKLMHERVYNLLCMYNFAKQGGAIGTFNLLEENGQACIVPNNALIQNVVIDVVTAGTTSASGTMAITAQTAGDLKAALAAASYTGLVAGIPVDTAATMIKLTADRTITGTIATGSFTAGKWYVHIRYVYSAL